MKTKISLSLIAALCLAVFIVSPALADKTYYAERFDVNVAVQPDGTLNVTETIVFRFSGGPFTYAFRELAFANLDNIDSVQARMDGQALTEGTQPGQVEIEAGRPIRVTWHFAPAQDAAHEFTLTYRVHGAVRQGEGGDTLVWRAIPEEHEYTIAGGSLRLEYPAGVTPLNAPTLSAPAAGMESSAGSVTFTLNAIEADTPVDLTVVFPAGSLIDQPPAWQAQQQQKGRVMATGMPFGLGAAAATILLGILGLFAAGRSFSRGDNAAQDYAFRNLSMPPRSIPPALAARLTGSSVSFLGTLFDLARRGVLSIEEGPKRWGGRTFEVVRQPSNERLEPHEQAFMEALFKKSSGGRVNLQKIASLASDSSFVQALDRELAASGWRDEERSKRRIRVLMAAIFGIVMGCAIFTGGMVLVGTLSTAAVVGFILAGIGAGLTAVGFLAVIVGASVSPLSDEGARQAAAWKGYGEYLRDVTRGRQQEPSPDTFERYLPYAAGLGLATEWTKFFQKQANVPVPDWFQGLQAGADDGSFAAIMAAVSSADSSASAAGAGAAGASGGGASGAG